MSEGTTGAGSTVLHHFAEFTATQFCHSVSFSNSNFIVDVNFKSAQFLGITAFEHCSFKAMASFKNVKFHSTARFARSKFSGHAGFSQCKFEGSGGLRECKFESTVSFEGAKFKDNAGFIKAEFRDVANFSGCNFQGTTRFIQALFIGYADFRDCVFTGFATFEAIQSKAAFDLARAHFYDVPDFNQANFVKAPRLNNLRIEHSRGLFRDNFLGDRESEKRWQALRQIAIQAHDHDQEQAFFKEEIKARRGVIDTRCHAAYWVGLLYQALSDFGRSILRPFVWWVLTFPFFAALYLWQSPASGGFWSSAGEVLRASLSAVLGFLGVDMDTGVVECVDGDGDPAASAFNLALRNGLLFASGVFSEKLPQTYACLYGLGEVAGRAMPLVPGWTTAVGALQVVVSAVLIFLILLALRNRFRIR